MQAGEYGEVRAPDAAQRVALAQRCAAEPGPYRAPVFGTVPVLRSGMKNAASRPGHVIAFLIQISNSQSVVIPGRASSARTRNPEVLDHRVHHVWIPGSLALGRKRPGMTGMILHSRGAMRPRFAISLARPARGDGAVGGARAPMGTLGGGIHVPTSHGKAPCAPKARRSASQRSTGHQAVDHSGAPRSGQLSLCPLKDRF